VEEMKLITLLAFVGVLVISVIIGWGLYHLIKNITFKKTVDRYQYVTVKDDAGNDILKVIDLEDRQEETNSISVRD
jgi:stage III sporulation protein SpoIIIAA